MKKTIILILSALMIFSVSAVAADSAEVSAQMSKTKKSKVQIKEVLFHAHLHCAGCVKKVQENISFEKGVKDLKVSLEHQTIAIKFDAAKTTEAVLKAAIEKLGVPVSVKCENSPEHHNHHEHQHGAHNHK